METPAKYPRRGPPRPSRWGRPPVPMSDRPFPTTAPVWTFSRQDLVCFLLGTTATLHRTPSQGLPWPVSLDGYM